MPTRPSTSGSDLVISKPTGCQDKQNCRSSIQSCSHVITIDISDRVICEVSPFHVLNFNCIVSGGISLASSADTLMSLPPTFTKFGQRTFAAAGRTAWSSLPSDIHLTFDTLQTLLLLNVILRRIFSACILTCWLVGWSLTSLFSANTAIPETNILT